MSYKTRAIPLRQLQGERGGEIATNFPQNVTGCTENTGSETEPCPGPGRESGRGSGLGPAVLRGHPSSPRGGLALSARAAPSAQGYPRSSISPDPTTTTTTNKKSESGETRVLPSHTTAGFLLN